MLLPIWATTLLATAVGSLASLLGIWVQIFQQERVDRQKAKSGRAATFGRLLAILREHSPDRAERLLENNDFLGSSWDTAQRLQEVEAELAQIAANDRRDTERIFRLIDYTYAYLDALPQIDHWEEEATPGSTSPISVVKAVVPSEELRSRYAKARSLAEDLLAG